MRYPTRMPTSEPSTTEASATFAIFHMSTGFKNVYHIYPRTQSMSMILDRFAWMRTYGSASGLPGRARRNIGPRKK